MNKTCFSGKRAFLAGNVHGDPDDNIDLWSFEPQSLQVADLCKPNHRHLFSRKQALLASLDSSIQTAEGMLYDSWLHTTTPTSNMSQMDQTIITAMHSNALFWSREWLEICHSAPVRNNVTEYSRMIDASDPQIYYVIFFWIQKNRNSSSDCTRMCIVLP